VWTLVTPYCKRTRPGRGTNTKAAGFPPLSRRSLAASTLPLRARPRARPIWAGARGYTHSSAQGTPRSRNADSKIDRKSTSGTCQFLGRSLVSWASKKQNFVALSTTEAEYIAAGHGCAQLLWMRQTVRDYGYKLTKVPLLCDNESAICMADNPVEHSRTKHIAIRYHFLRDHQQWGDIEIAYVSTKEQLADIFSKPLDEKNFYQT
jgi:hypothetical protein